MTSKLKLSMTNLKQAEEREKLLSTEAESRTRKSDPAVKSRPMATEPEETFWSDTTEELEEEQFLSDELEEQFATYGRTFSEERLINQAITRFFSKKTA